MILCNLSFIGVLLVLLMRTYGTDSVGGGRDVYNKAWEERQSMQYLLPGLDALEAQDPEN